MTEYDRILPDYVPEQILPGRKVEFGDTVITVERVSPDAMYSGPEEYEGYDIALGWIVVGRVDSGISPSYAELYGVAGLGIRRGEEQWVIYLATAGQEDGYEVVYLYVVQLKPQTQPVLDRILS